MEENVTPIATEEKDETVVTNNGEVIDNEFINDDNIEEFRMMNVLAKRNDIKNITDNFKKEQEKFISDDELLDKVEEAIADMDIKDIEKLTGEEVANIFTIDGEERDLNINVGDRAKDIEFKRDFLIFSKKSNTAMQKLDEELAVIDKEIAENEEEFKRIITEFGNMTNLIRSKIADAAETTDDESKRTLYTNLLAAFDYGYTLDNVKEFYKNNSFKRKSILGDYHDNKRSMSIYKKYKRVIEKLNITTDLTRFSNLEIKFLPDEYHKHNNIFMFAIISMIAGWENRPIDKTNGLFITQFCVNVKNLFYNKFETEEDRAKFIGNIVEVLSIID